MGKDLNKHFYEDPNYWSSRATHEGVATNGWSACLNDFYYSIKERYVNQILATLSDGGKVLEVGCGVGRIGMHIHTLRPDLILYGADFSDGMLHAASRTGAYSFLIKADIAQLPFCHSSFDLVLAMDVLFHVVRVSLKGRAWSEVGRVAKTEEGIVAYNTAHELTSLVAIEKLTNVLLPGRWISQRLRDQIIMSATTRIDKG